MAKYRTPFKRKPPPFYYEPFLYLILICFITTNAAPFAEQIETFSNLSPGAQPIIQQAHNVLHFTNLGKAEVKMGDAYLHVVVPLSMTICGVRHFHDQIGGMVNNVSTPYNLRKIYLKQLPTLTTTADQAEALMTSMGIREMINCNHPSLQFKTAPEPERRSSSHSSRRRRQRRSIEWDDRWNEASENKRRVTDNYVTARAVLNCSEGWLQLIIPRMPMLVISASA